LNNLVCAATLIGTPYLLYWIW